MGNATELVSQYPAAAVATARCAARRATAGCCDRLRLVLFALDGIGPELETNGNGEVLVSAVLGARDVLLVSPRPLEHSLC